MQFTEGLVGEPLLQKDVYPLMERLLERGKMVLLETGGHVSLAQVPEGRGIFGPLTVWENLRLGAFTRRDPVADDLATLALDMLVDEAGYLRSGPNPLFVPGEGE